jgi:mono/diheme cytochrome c family protein
MTVFTRIVVVLSLLTLGTWAVAGGAAQSRPQPAPSLAIKSTYGADLYQFYCSSCHGATGRGVSTRRENDPPLPDLRALANRNNGVFPRDRVRSTITFGKGSSEIRAHGTEDMPVWGTIFRGLEPSDGMTEIRIENLVTYLESLQDRPRGEERHR